ncbi:MAG: type II secretion system protein GspG [Bradymonadaceae bacterium]
MNEQIQEEVEDIKEHRTASLAARAMKPIGMTLVEIMIVITIMASIMGVVGFFVFGALDQANAKTAGLEIGQLEGLVNTYYLMSTPRRLPDRLEELTTGPSPLTKEVPLDPWGNEYVYIKHSNRDFTIFSPGADGIPNTEDDITNE